MEVEDLTKKLQTMKPQSPRKQQMESSTPILSPPHSGGEGSPIDQFVSSNLPTDETQFTHDADIVPIPQLARQFTAPNDGGEEDGPQGEYEESQVADIFSGSPAIDPPSDDDDDYDEDESGHETQTAPVSPIPRSRRVSEDRMPHLLNSLQKKLLMVRQTSVEVSETYDRLSSPTKKSQNRPNPFLFPDDRRESSTGSPSNFDEQCDHGLKVDDKCDRLELTMTPYRPVALFHDLAEEAQSEERPAESTKESFSPSAVSSTPLHYQSSPVVVLYTDSVFKSTIPSITPQEFVTDFTDKNDSLKQETTIVPPPQSKDGRSSHSSRPSSSDTDLSQYTLKEGFLMKRGFVNKAFQRRWCVLRGKEICYFKQYRDKEVRGRINCCNATVTRAENHHEDLPFAFYIDTPKDR
jgi:hypothetical protein